MYPFAIGLLALLCYQGIASCEKSQSLVVNLAQGPVRGYRDPEHDIYAFYDIPYAKAPTGSNRFKAPLPPPKWSDVFEAVDKVVICPQGNLAGLLPDKRTMQEDCLTASVYVPEKEEKNLPVLVIVHGGGFVMGWGNLIKPRHIVNSQKLIVVTFNYRLGAHGFLCLGTEDAPGNAGMKDQVALLRWVQNNIAKFGGNADDVTISGTSAGSASVDLLMISKVANNLFKKVIPESGPSTACFVIQADPIKNAKDYATLLSAKKFEDLHSLTNYYKTHSCEEINSGNMMNITNGGMYMSPCVERDLGQEMFLDDSPFNILKSGNFKKIPMLYGFDNMEGLIRVPLFDHWKNLMNTKFSDFLPADLKFKSESEKEQVAEKVKHFYFGDDSVSEKHILTYINYFTDVMFVYPTIRSVKLQLEAGNNEIYLYEYTYYDDDTPVVPYTDNVRGATHCAQTDVVLDGYFNHTLKSTSEELKEHRKIMRELWLNFITTGKPVPKDSKLPKWPPVGTDGAPHMSLGRTVQLKGSLHEEKTLFWEDIYKKYYSNPIPPTPLLKHTEL